MIGQTFPMTFKGFSEYDAPFVWIATVTALDASGLYLCSLDTGYDPIEALISEGELKAGKISTRHLQIVNQKPLHHVNSRSKYENRVVSFQEHHYGYY